MLHDTSCGISNVWLVNGYQRRETKWGRGVSFSDPDGLTRAIMFELCLSNHLLTGESVRFLRRRLELTQDELGIELGCTGQAIAKWEKGEIASVPVSSARLLRLLVVSRVAPETPIDQALAEYNEAPPERMEFAYDEALGWHCTAHQHAAIVVSVRRTNVIDFADVMGRVGRFSGFDTSSLSAFVSNDQEFVHASKLAATGK